MAPPIGISLGAGFGVFFVILMIIAAVLYGKKLAREAHQGRNLRLERALQGEANRAVGAGPAVQIAPRQVEMNDIPTRQVDIPVAIPIAVNLPTAVCVGNHPDMDITVNPMGQSRR